METSHGRQLVIQKVKSEAGANQMQLTKAVFYFINNFLTNNDNSTTLTSWKTGM